MGGGEILCDQFFHRQVAKEDKFLDLNIVPRVCPWRSFFHRQAAKEDKFSDLNIIFRVCPLRSWRLGGLKFFSCEPISPSKGP